MEKQYLAVDMGSSSGKVLLAELTKEKRIQMREVGRFATPRVFLPGLGVSGKGRDCAVQPGN